MRVKEQWIEHVGDLAVFGAVVDAGGFTAAAAQLGLSKSAVSSRVRRLEARLGVKLLNRTTRRMALTEAGGRLARRVELVGGELEQASEEASALGSERVGRIRVNAPVSLGQRHLAEPTARFLCANPRVSIELDLSERRVDMIAEQYDLAIRVGPLGDSSLRARKLATSRQLVVASPDYLARRGRPQTPADLREHDCLLYRHQLTGAAWEFGEGRGRSRVRVRGPMLSDNGDCLASAARAGLGLASLPDFIVAEAIARGELAVVLDDHCRSLSPIHALFVEGRLMSNALRAYLDLLGDHFRRLAGVAFGVALGKEHADAPEPRGVS